MAKDKNPEAPPLSPELRAVLERHAIVEPAPTPDLASLIGAVRRMGGSLTIRSLGDPSTGSGQALGYAATVEMDGGSFDASDDHSALAVAQTFAQALTATFPTRSGLFDAERPAYRAGRANAGLPPAVGRFIGSTCCRLTIADERELTQGKTGRRRYRQHADSDAIIAAAKSIFDALQDVGLIANDRALVHVQPIQINDPDGEGWIAVESSTTCGPLGWPSPPCAAWSGGEPAT